MINNGTYKILYIQFGDSGYLPVGCLTENSFSESVESFDTTTRQNPNGWGTSIPVKQSFSISFSGVETFDDLGDTIVSYYRLQVLKRARQVFNWKIYSSLGGNTESGSGFISSLSNTAPLDDVVSFDGEIVGYGEPEITIGVPPDETALVEIVPIYENAKID